MVLSRWLVASFSLALAGCLAAHDTVVDGGLENDASCDNPFDQSAPVWAGPLRISELLSSNDGVNVDELGETDDWIELENDSDLPVQLGDYWLSDAQGNRQRLPAQELAPHAVILLWADDSPSQGETHLKMKLSASGERLTLWTSPCSAVDRVEVPALPTNESYARLGGVFSVCRYASPEAVNPAACTPPPPPTLRIEHSYKDFQWPADFPAAKSPLALNELALRPAAFIEVLNTSAQAVTLAEYTLAITASAPSDTMTRVPHVIGWPAPTLEAGARLLVPLQEADVAELGPEGSVSITNAGEVDRVQFNDWPVGAVLARLPDASGPFTFCNAASAGAPNTCDTLTTRVAGDRVRGLHTADDFAQLGKGSTELGQTAVKFIVDMQDHDAVHLLDGEHWALHYTFIREQVYGQPALDRCDPVQTLEFDQGWYEFSTREYFRLEGRRFLLGTLVRHASGIQTIEFASGDVIDAPLMRRAFMAVIARTRDPRSWSLRPNDSGQASEMARLDGTLPIVDRNAPFANVSYQPLTRAVGYGTLRFVPSAELASAQLGQDTILITDDVPNDVPMLGGLITEAFQNPLAHVNVLSEARGTPNMALDHARTRPEVSALLGTLVRLEVGTQNFTLTPASAAEADAFWQARKPSGPRVVPPSDLSQRALLPLTSASLAALPIVGAKAAQFAELYRVSFDLSRCGSVPTFEPPPDAFAVPMVHYAEHLTASGARKMLEAALADPAFRGDLKVRASVLDAVRAAIMAWPVQPTLLAEIEAAVRTHFGTGRVRFRSSSNCEDLPSFNGAGLHTSISAELADPDRKVADALRTVWASLWNLRAYDEREAANLDQLAAGMGVLVHDAFLGELNQGVAISRNLLDVTRGDFYYVNAQHGEASVTNPAPGVLTEQLIYAWPPREPQISYQTRSSLNHGRTVLGTTDLRSLACALEMVHQHFRPLLDPERKNHFFAMQVEFKFERDHQLVIKQARPQPFGHLALPSDCR